MGKTWKNSGGRRDWGFDDSDYESNRNRREENKRRRDRAKQRHEINDSEEDRPELQNSQKRR